MDPGRYGVQPGWDNNSALDRYPAVHEPNFRVDDSYDDRRYIDDIYPRNTFQQEPPVGGGGSWPQSRRRSYEDAYHYHPLDRDSYPYDDFHERPSRYSSREPPRDGYGYDDYDYRNREDSRERDYEYGSGRHSYDSDYERGGGGGRREREGSWRRRGSRDRKGLSPYRRSRSHGRDDRIRSRSKSRSRSRSRSPRSRSSRGRSYREDSYDDDRSDRHDRSDRRRDRDEYRHHDHYSTVPSPTVVVKGLSQKTTEEDLYQMLAEWGPLRHVRVIKERNSGVSRGFAFIDFPTAGSARLMMEKIGDEGLVVDGRKLLFEYSKPTGGSGFGSDGGSSRSGHMNHRSTTVLSDWMCTICGCVNFARRTACFQCNEPRTEDAPPADMSSSNGTSFGRKGDTGPTHVLVVRGLDENSDEEMLRYEFSKHAPIKDIRLVRDKFTHVSRGFAFVHFHSVEDATKALEATNGTTLEKNGQILRVAYAKSILGPATGPSSSHSSSLAAAAIEAAAFSQQYDAVGWAPKEYNPDDKQTNGNQDQGEGQKDGSAPQSGFVWDEASGYYYDAASGFYYDGNTGLYYDGNNGIWYTYDQNTQQYLPCEDNNNNKKENNEPSKATTSSKKVVISAPASTTATSLPEAVQAAALAAEKKEKEKMKEIKLASKSSILASKKKMSNVLSMWKQRSHESQTPGSQQQQQQQQQQSLPILEKEKSNNNNNVTTPTDSVSNRTVQPTNLDHHAQDVVRSVSSNNISGGGGLRGVIRGSGGRGVVGVGPTEVVTSSVPFRTDASALGSYAPPTATVSGRRRFSEAPVHVKEPQPHSTGYRDRAAERRSLYGSSSFGDDLSDVNGGDPNGMKRDSMPFPPGVGGGGPRGEGSSSYEVITSEKAIDETNVGNRMLRNMGWQEGAGLGKDGSGMVEPVQAQATEKRAGLGSQPKKSLDPSLEVQAGDSYRTLIQKKALARFREMS